LSSEQALTYHLNKKYRCGTWKCEKCGKGFDTKFDKNIHEMNCCSTATQSLQDELMEIYKTLDSIQIGNKQKMTFKNRNIVIEYLKE